MRASSGPSTYELPEVQRYGSRACFGLRKLSNRCFHRSASDRSALRGCRKLFSSPCGSGASHRCVHRVEWVAIAKFTRALGSSFAPELSAASGPWSAHERCSRFTTVPAGSFEFARRALPASSSRLRRRYASGRAACRSSQARAKAHSPTHECVQVIECRDGGQSDHPAISAINWTAFSAVCSAVAWSTILVCCKPVVSNGHCIRPAHRRAQGTT